MLQFEEIIYIAQTGVLIQMNCWYARLKKKDNDFDPYAIKVCKIESDMTVRHLPREIFRPTTHLLLRGADITAKLIGSDYRRSPLFQGGLEIPCLVTVGARQDHAFTLKNSVFHAFTHVYWVLSRAHLYIMHACMYIYIYHACLADKFRNNCL